MTKETTKKATRQSACEQYVIERVRELEKENKQLLQRNIDLQYKYSELYNLVMNGLRTAKIKESEYRYNICHIEMFNTFVASIYKDLSKEDNDDIKAFVELINFVKR